MRHSGIVGPIALAVAAALAFAPAGGPSDAHGTGMDVNSTDDRPDVLPGDGNCADGLGLCTLRAAVIEANAQLGPNEIHLPAGTYTLTLAGAERGRRGDGRPRLPGRDNDRRGRLRNDDHRRRRS